MRRFAGVSLALAFVACSHDYAKLRGTTDGAAVGSGGRGSGGDSGAGTGGSVADTGGGSGTGAVTGSGGRGGTGGSVGIGGGVNTGGTAAGSGGASATGGRGGIGGVAPATGGRGGTGGGAPATGGAPADGGTCSAAGYTFVARTPTVHLLVDRSMSMFDCISTTGTVEPSCANQTDTIWGRLKDSALMVVGALQAQVRFGFTAFTGTNPMGGGTCPILNTVAPAVNNQAAIAAAYNGLPMPPNTTVVGMKFEGPAKLALDTIGGQLMADPTAGDKYIMFITDGQPDYCDDGNLLCAPDSVVGSLQTLKAKGVTTIVMGLQSAVFDLPPGILDTFATAGAGEPTLAPLRPATDVYSFYDQCSNVPGWRMDAVATNKPFSRGVTVGTYAMTGGPTKPYMPDGTNQAMIQNQLSQALAGVKSCVFDLKSTMGGGIKVDATKIGGARVLVNGNAVPQDATNGWSLASTTQVMLNGTACTTWRMPASTTIDFQFPCESIVPQ